MGSPSSKVAWGSNPSSMLGYGAAGVYKTCGTPVPRPPRPTRPPLPPRPPRPPRAPQSSPAVDIGASVHPDAAAARPESGDIASSSSPSRSSPTKPCVSAADCSSASASASDSARTAFSCASSTAPAAGACACACASDADAASATFSCTSACVCARACASDSASTASSSWSSSPSALSTVASAAAHAGARCVLAPRASLHAPTRARGSNTSCTPGNPFAPSSALTLSFAAFR